MDTVCVTGASGFIATHVIQILLKDGFKVKGSVRSLTNEKKINPLKQLAQAASAADRLELVEADLDWSDVDQWKQIITGCKYVLHIASPFPPKEPTEPEKLINTAIKGTLNVLKACAQVDSVRRVIVTGSLAAVCGGTVDYSHEYNEEDWINTDDRKASTYNKSKALAEQAAWKLWRELPDKSKFELAVILPGIIWGPVLHDSDCSSFFWLLQLLNCEIPMVGPFSMPIVDVRDVAKAHIKAMLLPADAINGQRFGVVSENVRFDDVAKQLSEDLTPKGYKIPTRVAPYWMLWLISWWDSTLGFILPHYAKSIRISNQKMVNTLGIQPISVAATLRDTVDALIEHGFVRQKPKHCAN